MEARDDDNLEHAHAASRAIVDLARLAELALAPFDLTLTQYRVLAHLDRGRSIQTNLAFKLAVTRQNVTRVIDVLVARGLVERSRDTTDRRRVHHALTPAGRRTVADADVAIDKSLHAVLRDLEDPDDERTVLHALDLVNAAVLASFERIKPVIDVAPGEKFSARPPRRS
jgi:DNA-binding MarR family transcriptional regulator